MANINKSLGGIKMEENFDCTQFFTFNSSLKEEKIDELLKPLKDMGFNVIKENDIRE